MVVTFHDNFKTCLEILWHSSFQEEFVFLSTESEKVTEYGESDAAQLPKLDHRPFSEATYKCSS